MRPRHLLALLIVGTTLHTAWALEIEDRVRQTADAWSRRTRTVVTQEALIGLQQRASQLRDTSLDGYEILSRYSVIRLIMEPPTPLDYVVWINGREYPATERSRYAVPPGTAVSLLVVRGKGKPCAWHLKVQDYEEVKCKLEPTLAG